MTAPQWPYPNPRIYAGSGFSGSTPVLDLDFTADPTDVLLLALNMHAVTAVPAGWTALVLNDPLWLMDETEFSLFHRVADGTETNVTVSGTLVGVTGGWSYILAVCRGRALDGPPVVTDGPTPTAAPHPITLPSTNAQLTWVVRSASSAVEPTPDDPAVYRVRWVPAGSNNEALGLWARRVDGLVEGPAVTYDPSPMHGAVSVALSLSLGGWLIDALAIG